jgi:hypothetical protein
MRKQRIGMSPMEFVIGGMDPAFCVALYRALRTLDAAGFKPGITCGFRDAADAMDDVLLAAGHKVN